MDKKQQLYCPFQHYSTARRNVPLPGQYYDPFSNKVMRPPLGNNYAFFDANRDLCSNIDQALYVVYNDALCPPPGFTRISSAFNCYGELLPSQAMTSEEEQQILWASSCENLHNQRPEQVESNEEAERNQVNTCLVGISPNQGIQPQIHEAQEETEEAYQLQTGTDGYYLKPLKSGKAKQVTNYTLQLQEVRHYIGMRGEELSEHRKIYFSIQLVKLGKNVNLYIEYEKLSGIVALIKRKVAEAIVYCHHALFAEQLDIFLRSILKDCPSTYEYTMCGWMQLPDQHWVYIHDDGQSSLRNVYFKSGFTFGRGQQARNVREIVNAGFSILRLSKDMEKIVVPFLWAHLGLLWSLFAQAGYPPHALLYISGVSGSLKTAVSKLLFNFTAITELDIPASFRDTSASMEISIDKYKDRVLLVDDYCPAANKLARRSMEQVLENLIRFYGDGNTKGRADPRMDKVYIKKARGLCTITGEDVAGSLSSQLRCLFLRISKDTFDGTVLKQFQAEPYLWTEYLACFVDSLFTAIPDVISQIQTNFQQYRGMAERVIRERRLVDTYCCLAVTAKIVLETAEKVSGEPFRDQWLKKFEQIALEVCIASEQSAIQQIPERLFAQTLMTLIQRQDVLLGTKEEFTEAPRSYLGAIEGGYWYLWPQETYQAVANYYNAGGGHFPLSANALWDALANTGVLIKTKTVRHGESYYENGTKVSFAGRPRLLKIDPVKVKELAE